MLQEINGERSHGKSRRERDGDEHKVSKGNAYKN